MWWKIFSYTPSKESDAHKNHAPAKLIDKSTLNGVYRKNSPYYGNFYPYRFTSAEDIHNFCDFGFNLDYLEKVGRTYRNTEEYFEFLTYSLIKK